MQELDILIAEDEPFQREMLCDFLIEEGHRVVEAGNGEDALRLLETSYFDLLLLDFKMPGLSGLDLLKEAKRLNPSIDAVIVTAFGTIETAVQAMKSGASDYLAKPI
ncbi:MAG: response regulator, partial [Syntrophobacteraceae bacterium]|nr:response regulator [Syntrophobacteraceae bacterium]